MTFELDSERELERARTGPTSSHDDVAPGRGLRSSSMTAPSRPIISGLLSRKKSGNAPDGLDDKSTTAIESAQESPSHGLPGPLRGELEQSTGRDLSSVRIHTGPASAQAATAISASAYTLGSDVHFGAGRYQPETSGGRSLIAHEVAHVVQNGGHASTSEGLSLSSPGDAHETEAHAFGHAFASGAPTTAPTARGGGIARAVVSRGGEHDDHPVTPTQGPKASAGVKAKLSTKGLTIAVPGSISHTLKGACMSATGKFTVTGSGSLEWPDVMPAGGPSVDVGKGGSKSAGGEGSESKSGHDVGVEKEIPLYEAKANDKAASEEEHQSWLDGLEVEKVELVAGAAGDIGKESSHGATKKEKSVNVSLNVKATLKNQMVITGGATIVNIKADPMAIEGPELQASVDLPIVHKDWDFGGNWKAKVNLAGKAELSIKPDWTALAREVPKFLADLGVAGALELAANLAVIAAPALCMVSAISMIEDETALFKWIIKEAHDVRDAAIALGMGMTCGSPYAKNERCGTAYAAGKAAAEQAMASMQLTPEQYAAGWKDDAGRRDRVFDQCWNTARSKYDNAVVERAREVYNNSWSERFWKTEADFVGRWRDEAARAFVS